MALIPCPECAKSVSDQAPQCIHCGYPLASQRPSEPHRTWRCAGCHMDCADPSARVCDFCGRERSGGTVEQAGASASTSVADGVRIGVGMFIVLPLLVLGGCTLLTALMLASAGHH